MQFLSCCCAASCSTWSNLGGLVIIVGCLGIAFYMVKKA